MVNESCLACETVASILTGRGSTPTSVHEVTDEYIPPTYDTGVTGTVHRACRRCHVWFALRYREVVEPDAPFVNPGSVATASWLAEHLEDPNVVIVDTRYTVEIDSEGQFRTVPGYDDYVESHIPGAVFVNLNDLKDPSEPAHILDTGSFARAMSAIGVSNAHEVVVYDTEGGTWAARLWWALRYHGHDKVRILDGGFTAWTARDLPTQAGEITPDVSHFEPAVVPHLRVEIDDVRRAVGSSGTIIVDALPEPFYTGQIPLYPHLRRGHIPGAANIPAPQNLDAATWELLPPHELEALWAPTIDGADRILTYCGGGVYGAFDLFVLHLLGYDAALYDGSWEEWGALEDTPIETGPDTTRNTPP